MITMTADQFHRLSAIQSKLFDVLAVESDPDDWPGAGLKPNAWDQQTRGDRYWSKKNAAATMSLIARAQQIFRAELTAIRHQPDPDASDETILGEPAMAGGDVDIDKEISRFERAAAKAIDRARSPGA